VLLNPLLDAARLATRCSSSKRTSIEIVSSRISFSISPSKNCIPSCLPLRIASSGDLFVRKLDQLQAIPLAGIDNARNPFFSPDGQWIAFFAGTELKKVSVTGGAAVPVCDAPTGRGGTWSDDDAIALADALPIAGQIADGLEAAHQPPDCVSSGRLVMQVCSRCAQLPHRGREHRDHWEPKSPTELPDLLRTSIERRRDRR
jgi:WD40 repeat protein